MSTLRIHLGASKEGFEERRKTEAHGAFSSGARGQTI